MTLLTGADSAVPQPDLYRGHDVWGVYIAGDTPHLWTHPEVAELGIHGVRGFLPIVVPPQKESWWVENEGYGTLEELVREAVAWGLPHGSPLILDVEEAQAVKTGSGTCHCWAVACLAHGYIPWLYGPAIFLARDHWCRHWLAKWFGEAGEDHEPPVTLGGFFEGWQYAGNVEGGRIDRDIFAAGHTYAVLTPELKVEVIMSVNPAEAAFGTPVPPNAPAEPTAEEIAVAEDVKVAEAPTEPAVPSPLGIEPAPQEEAKSEPKPGLSPEELRAKIHAAVDVFIDSFFA